MRKQLDFDLLGDDPVPEKQGLDGALFYMHSPGGPGGGGGPRGGFGHGGPGGGRGGPGGGRSPGFGMGPRPPMPPRMWWPYYRRPGCGCFTLVILTVVIGVVLKLVTM